MTVHFLKNNWEWVCEKIPKTITRVAFKKSGKPVQCEDRQGKMYLTLVFESEFNFKIASKTLDEMGAVLKELFGGEWQVCVRTSSEYSLQCVARIQERVLDFIAHPKIDKEEIEKLRDEMDDVLLTLSK